MQDVHTLYTCMYVRIGRLLKYGAQIRGAPPVLQASVKRTTIVNSEQVVQQASSSEFVKNRDLRLMYLHADSFDYGKAAQRLMDYLEIKLWLFGEEKLTKEITQADLSPEDTEFLKLGFDQLLNEPDRAGRAVMIHIPALIPEVIDDPMNFVRTKAMFFFCCPGSETLLLFPTPVWGTLLFFF